jgi:hypothetical protein
MQPLANWYQYAMFFFSENYSRGRINVSQAIPPVEHDENTKKLDTDASDIGGECVVCFDNPPEVVFVKCGHNVICCACANATEWKTCPVCRAAINSKEEIVKIYRC